MSGERIESGNYRISRRQVLKLLPFLPALLANQPPTDILYQADFSNWPNDSAEGCGLRFFDQASREYHMVSSCLGSEYLSYVNQPFGDFDYRITTSQPIGSNIAGYGICVSFDTGSLFQRLRLLTNRRGELEIAQIFETIPDEKLLFMDSILFKRRLKYGSEPK